MCHNSLKFRLRLKFLIGLARQVTITLEMLIITCNVPCLPGSVRQLCRRQPNMFLLTDQSSALPPSGDTFLLSTVSEARNIGRPMINSRGLESPGRRPGRPGRGPGTPGRGSLQLHGVRNTSLNVYLMGKLYSLHRINIFYSAVRRWLEFHLR